MLRKGVSLIRILPRPRWREKKRKAKPFSLSGEAGKNSLGRSPGLDFILLAASSHGAFRAVQCSPFRVQGSRGVGTLSRELLNFEPCESTAVTCAAAFVVITVAGPRRIFTGLPLDLESVRRADPISHNV